MEAIQKLLQSTGLSPDELIKQLAEYKAISGSQLIPTVDDKDENKNETLTNGITNGASSHTNDLMDDTSLGDISDKIRNGIRTECANVGSPSKPQTDHFNINCPSVKSDPRMYLCNTNRNSVNSDNSLQSVTITSDSSEVVDDELGQVFQSCKPQNINTAKPLCNTEVDSVVQDQVIESADDNEMADNLKSGEGTELFSYDDEMTISEVFKSDTELSNCEQLNSDFNSNQGSVSSEDFIRSERLDISEELSFNEELQISEEEQKCDGESIINQELTDEGLSFTGGELTCDGGLTMSEKLRPDGSTATNLNCEEFKSGGVLLAAEEVLSVPENVEADKELPTTEESEEVVSTHTKCNEELAISKGLKSDEVLLSTSKELKGKKIKSVWGLETQAEVKSDKELPISNKLETDSGLSKDKELKGYENLSSSDKLSLVWGLPLGKDVINDEELSLSDKLRSAWGLPPAKMFNNDKPLPKSKKIKFAWGLTPSKGVKSDAVLSTSKTVNSIWGLPTSEELKSTEGVKSKSVWGLATNDELKSSEQLLLNEGLKTVQGKELTCSKEAIKKKSKCKVILPSGNKIKSVKKLEISNDVTRDDKLLTNLPIDNEKLTENSKSNKGLSATTDSIEDLTHNDKTKGTKQNEDPKCDGVLAITEKSKCELAASEKPVFNEVLEIIENSKYNEGIAISESSRDKQVLPSSRNLNSDDKVPINKDHRYTVVLSTNKTVRCEDDNVEILSSPRDTENQESNGKSDEVMLSTQDKNIDVSAAKIDVPCEEIYDLTIDDDDDDLETTCSDDLDYVEGGYADQMKEEIMDDSDDTIVNSEEVMLYTEECKEINSAKDEATNKSKEDPKDDCMDSSNINKTEENDNSLSRKRPIMGYIRKRCDKSKEKKIIQPPWLDNEPNQSEGSLNMREQIFSQLQQLRKRKINETPLVDIVNPIPQMYSKRVCKYPDTPELSGTKLGIQIVEVRGGIMEDNVRQQQVSSPGIKLTKTQDITKIKGWRRKKLLVDKEIVKEPSYTVKSAEPSLLINIPVVSKNLDVIDSAASCSYSVDDKPEKSDKAIEDIALNVFASNNLEGFLTQQKSLNISYNVPNLESSNHTVDYLDSTVLMAQPQEEKAYLENRRRFRLADNEDCNTLRQNSRSDSNKPRTLAEKRKLLEQSEVLQKEEVSNSSLIYSNIYYRGSKLRIPSRFKKAIYIDFHHKSRKQYKYVAVDKNRGRKRKLSILNSPAMAKPEISYKPGPLCRKQFLQKSGFGEWESVLKKLPKLKVQILPKIGKPIHPAAVPFVKFDTFDISEERADFALSALLGNPDDKNKTFTFDVSYERQQENILMRKKIIKKEEVKTEFEVVPSIKVYAEDVDGVVQHVVDDLITCIENSEIENDIIKEDPDFTPYVEDSSTPIKYKEKKSKTEVIKGSARRTNLELKRLNVKVIEVNIEDDQNPMDECLKPFCKLGCVCSSLNKTTLPSDHCGNYLCIFKCKCAKKNDTLKFSLPHGTDILSERTVSRLQDAAKRDLAKVEREFTQTVIHANNKTIVFGDTIDRKRRSLKFPKRYQDYVETNLLSDVMDEQPIRIVQLSPVPEKRELPKMSPCFVKLQKLNLEHVIPYCWPHNTYDCDCGCTAVPYKKEIRVFELQVNRPGNKNENEKVEEVQEGTKKFKFTPSNCARTKGLSTSFYLKRNRMGIFKRKIAKKLLAEKSGDNILLNKWFNMSPFSERTLNIESKKCELPPEPISANPVEIKPSRRKQVLITRDELAQRAQETHTQPLNEPAVEINEQQEILSGKSNNPDVLDDLFQNSTEVYKPSDLVGEKFNQLLGMSNDKESDYRLLQWSTLLARYEAGVWEIWTARTESKVRFVITHSNVKKVNEFINIRSFASVADKESIKTDFIRWIVTRSAPGNKQPENTLLILKKTYALWEVCGMCAKNTNKKGEGEQKSNMESICTLKNSLFSQKLPFTSKEYYMKELAPEIETSEDSLNFVLLNESAKIEAALPNILDDCKWRILKVNSTFNVLAFTRNQQRIKCSELLSMIKLARRKTKTLIITRVSESYSHKQFAIFISHNHPDKIFIGPYFDYETHDFETLRFLNNKLVSTEEFCKVTGQKIEAPTGTWFKQLTSKIQTSETITTVIDLTDIEDNSVQNKAEGADTSDEGVNSSFAENEDKIIPTIPNLAENEKNMNFVAKPTSKSPRSLLKSNNLPELNDLVINNEKKKTASIEKMFLARLKSLMRMSNFELPPATYPICFKVNFTCDIILGFKSISEEVVGVYWPGTNKPRLFQNHEYAAEWLRDQLSQLFVTIPKTFRISVNLVEYSNYLDLMIVSKKSMNLAAYCDEVHIVGVFGVLKMKDVVTLMNEYTLRPKKPKDLKNKLENNSLEYRKIVLRFLKKHDITDIGFARPLILQMVSQLETLLKIEQKQIFTTENLEKLKTSLQARYRTLLGEENPPNSTSTADVICLDSDEEDLNPLKKSSTILEHLNTTLTLGPLETSTAKQGSLTTDTPELTITPIDSDADTGLVNFTNTSEIGTSNTSEDLLEMVESVNSSVESSSTSNLSEDSIRRFINIASLNESPLIQVSGNGLHLNVNSYQRALEANAVTPRKNIVLTLMNGQVLAAPVDKVKVPKNLPVTKVLMLPTQRLIKPKEPIERIDLSNFSTNSVSSMLGANLTSKKVMLTKAQLNGLKAISEQSKLKRLFLNKIDCDREASVLEDTLSTT